MRLFGRKRSTRARSFQHWYDGKLPPALNDESTALLESRLKHGDRSVISEIIVGHLRLGAQTVGYYLQALGGVSQADELMSVMSEAVTEAVNEVANGVAVENMTGYILSQIHTRISNFLEREHVVYIPGSTIRRRKMRGKPTIERPVISEIGPTVREHLCREDFALLEVETTEIIDKICLNLQEHQVVQLRLEGYTDAEIGSQLGLTKWSVYVIRKGLMARAKTDFPNQRS